MANVAARADGYIRTYSEMCHALDCVYLYKTLYDHNLQYLYPENGVAPQYVGSNISLIGCRMAALFGVSRNTYHIFQSSCIDGVLSPLPGVWQTAGHSAP